MLNWPDDSNDGNDSSGDDINDNNNDGNNNYGNNDGDWLFVNGQWTWVADSNSENNRNNQYVGGVEKDLVVLVS